MDQQNQQPPVIACSLTDKELAARLEELTQALFAQAEHVAELDDGYAFRFSGSAEQAQHLTTFVLEERQCCPFFRFDLRFDPYDGPITLSLRGTAEVKAFTTFLFNDIRRMNGVLGTAD